MDISTLEPKAIWKQFAAINAVPRGSKREEQIIAFMLDFGKSLQLDTSRDTIGNVVIKKPASDGYAHKQTLVLQAHLDMVHQKNADKHFDFDVEGIKMWLDGDWVRAAGTTLGADNGIGVATMMALLAATDIAHPPIEALFTIDEETGMTGAKSLSSELLTGKLMINLDTEEDNEITIGCAGGLDITSTGRYDVATLDQHYGSLHLVVKGLRGGHSGMDIDKGLGNANKLLTRILYALLESEVDLHLQRIDAGGLRNAIPREATALLACPMNQIKEVERLLQNIGSDIKQELRLVEPDLHIGYRFEEVLESTQCMEGVFQRRLVRALQAVHNGVYRMSPSIKGLVETSNNVAKITVNDSEYAVLCLTRSSVESSKIDLAVSIKSVFDLLGADTVFSGDYPGWEPEAHGELVQLARESYVRLFEEEPHVNACHAGLECGLIGEKYPGMKMVSIGPTIRGAHSPDERVSVVSVQKFWRFFLDILKHTP